MNNETFRQNQIIVQDNRHYFALSKIDGRNTNDDSFCISSIVPNIDQSPVYLLAVADGMGGYDHGKDISEQVLRQLNSAMFDRLTISPNLNQFPAKIDLFPEALGYILWEGICQAHAFSQRLIRNNRWDKAGTTIVAALIYQQTAIVTNVGDSPLFY